MKYILIIVVLFFSLPLNSQSVLGYWKTYTKNNQEQALIIIDVINNDLLYNKYAYHFEQANNGKTSWDFVLPVYKKLEQ
mgnify:CR=1 FL=1